MRHVRGASNPEGINQYTAGGSARFDGKSADGKVEGSMDVKIVDPHSNAHKVTDTTKTGKRVRMYEGGNIHIPTATVQNARGTTFEAYHHTLSPLKGAQMQTELRTLHFRTNGAPLRTITHEGREHLVIPCVALREGVIHAVNADVPEFVSAKRLAAAASTWNGRPLVIGHPVRNGRQISANEPEVLAAQGFGVIYASAMNGENLGMEAWVDVTKLEALGQHGLLADLRAGKTTELSVGAFVKTLARQGIHRGKRYLAEWTDIVGDHLAFLPNAKGACSIEMGCGTHRMAEAAEEELRGASNPEGINQYTGGGGSKDSKDSKDSRKGPHAVGSKVKGSMVGHIRYGMTGTVKEPLKNDHYRVDFGHSGGAELIHKSQIRGAEGQSMTKSHRAARDIPQSQRDKLKDSDFAGPGTSFPIVKPADVSAAAHLIGKAKNPDAVKARIIAIAQRKGKSFTDKLPEAWVKAAAAFDTPAQAASEEAAELITYQTMRDLMDAVGKQWDSASGLVDDLVAAEQEDAATETPAEEEAEEETECSQMESLAVLCGSMAAALMQVQSLCWKELAPDPAYPPRYMEEGGEPKTLVGKTISKNTMKSIQGMHDAAHAAHDHSTALGAQCNGMRLMAAAKMEDCPTCDGSGEVDGNPCETCEGEGEVPIKAAEANDNHDGAVPIIEEGDTYMTKDERNATIKALAACDCSGFKGDAATLETLTDARLEALQAATKQREDAVKTAETATKEATDLKAAAAAVKPVEPKVLTVEEFMAVAPAELKTLIETKKAEDATATATLVAQLKTAQTAYTEDELKALDLVHLRKLASIAKIDAPAPVFTGLSFPRAAAPPVDHTIPPDPYAPGLKALAEQRKH